MKRLGAMMKGGVHLGSIYLNVSIGPSAKKNLDLLHMVAAVLVVVGGPCKIGGEWNCSSEQLQATGWLQMVGGMIIAPDTTTCNNSTIYFSVVSKVLANAVHSVHVIADALFKPHSPVRLLLRRDHASRESES